MGDLSASVTTAAAPPSLSGREGRPSSNGGISSSGSISSPWAVACADVLVRRLVLRFALVRTALELHAASREWRGVSGGRGASLL